MVYYTPQLMKLGVAVYSRQLSLWYVCELLCLKLLRQFSSNLHECADVHVIIFERPGQKVSSNSKFLYIHTSFYPTITTLFDRNRPAVYTIAICGRLYTAEWRQM